MKYGHGQGAQGGGTGAGRLAGVVAVGGRGWVQVSTSFLAAGGDGEVRAAGCRSTEGGETGERRAVGAESSSLDGSLMNAVAVATLR